MNQRINVDLRSSDDSQASLPRELRGRRRGSIRLRKHLLGDFHQLFRTREDQGDISCYRLGDVVVLHSGWRAQGLEPGAMVTVKSVLPSGVEVYFESRQEGGRNAVLIPQDLSTWDLSSGGRVGSARLSVDRQRPTAALVMPTLFLRAVRIHGQLPIASKAQSSRRPKRRGSLSTPTCSRPSRKHLPVPAGTGPQRGRRR